MKKLLLAAAALVCVPAALYAQQQLIVPNDDQDITDTELAQRALVCASLATDELQSNEVITAYKLDTNRKVRDFALQCRMMMYGYELANQGYTT
jgi:hypothetical protein